MRQLRHVSVLSSEASVGDAVDRDWACLGTAQNDQAISSYAFPASHCHAIRAVWNAAAPEAERLQARADAAVAVAPASALPRPTGGRWWTTTPPIRKYLLSSKNIDCVLMFETKSRVDTPRFAQGVTCNGQSGCTGCKIALKKEVHLNTVASCSVSQPQAVKRQNKQSCISRLHPSSATSSSAQECGRRGTRRKR